MVMLLLLQECCEQVEVVPLSLLDSCVSIGLQQMPYELPRLLLKVVLHCDAFELVFVVGESPQNGKLAAFSVQRKIYFFWR